MKTLHAAESMQYKDTAWIQVYLAYYRDRIFLYFFYIKQPVLVVFWVMGWVANYET